jgi:hypothetical protein
MTELSPAAQAIWDAFNEDEAGVFVDYGDKLAAAFRAAADQVVPEDYNPPRAACYPEAQAFVDGKECRNESVRFQLLAIAAELEGADG